jgi:RNA polymerase sigma factor (sigma-70 family)
MLLLENYSYTRFMPDDDIDWADVNLVMFVELNRLIELEQVRQDGLVLTDSDNARHGLRQVRIQIEVIKEQIVEQNSGLVVSEVQKFARGATHEQVEDYIAAGKLGLLQAINSYEPSLGKFSGWAYKPIMREVHAAVRWAEYPDHSERQFVVRSSVRKAKRQLEEMNVGVEPTVEQIAERAEVSVEHAQSVLRHQGPISTSAASVREQLNRLPVPSPVSEGYAELATQRIWSEYLLEATNGVPQDELMVLLRHDGLDGEPPESFEAIGARIGKSRETARKLDARARRRIEDAGYRVPSPLE